ncbi:hypothetical protein [Streptomyces sp. KN37]|uniref:hypothetical protein n=1 Tax=Streptomyces sp. KN37 TaxID=3090667 RepID=UPI002A764849|nr:hypothetical protein [Streptomyces sp. KN37]WPO76711.1 hypothetical protein R9806_39485 [Streptomyces sp. KN37]
MAAPTIREHPSDEVSERAGQLADIFDLDPTQQDIDRLGVWFSGDEDEDDGDTTGDGCGESPPQGPTSGC